VIILAGTNDIARNNGPQMLEMIQQNVMAMTELAKAHGIRVVLCSVLPITDAKTGQSGVPIVQSAQRPPADIQKLNAWLADYAKSSGAVFADYYAAAADEKGFLRAEDTNDGLHPNAAGYALMVPVAAAAIEKALRGARPD